MLLSLTSNWWGNSLGWYIDDMRVIGPGCQVPPPAGLAAQPGILGDVSLTWTPPAGSTLDRIRVYRGAAAGGMLRR